jgi:hypothetical protein
VSYALTDAIRDRIKAQVADAEGVAVHYPNQKKFEPPSDGSLWVRYAVLVGTTNQVDISGSGSLSKHRTVGVLVVKVMSPLGTGDKANQELSDVVAAAFRAVSTDGVAYRSPKIGGGARAGAWWQVTVDIPFQSDLNA